MKKIVVFCFALLLAFSSFNIINANETEGGEIKIDENTTVDGNLESIESFKSVIEESAEFLKIKDEIKGVFLERSVEDGEEIYTTIAYRLDESTDGSNIVIFLGNKQNDILYAAIQNTEGTKILIDKFSKSRLTCGFYVCTATKTEKIKGNYCSAALGKLCGSFPGLSYKRLIYWATCKGVTITGCQLMRPEYTVCTQHVYKANICDM